MEERRGANSLAPNIRRMPSAMDLEIPQGCQQAAMHHGYLTIFAELLANYKDIGRSDGWLPDRELNPGLIAQLTQSDRAAGASYPAYHDCIPT